MKHRKRARGTMPYAGSRRPYMARGRKMGRGSGGMGKAMVKLLSNVAPVILDRVLPQRKPPTPQYEEGMGKRRRRRKRAGARLIGMPNPFSTKTSAGRRRRRRK